MLGLSCFDYTGIILDNGAMIKARITSVTKILTTIFKTSFGVHYLRYLICGALDFILTRMTPTSYTKILDSNREKFVRYRHTFNIHIEIKSV